MKTITLSNAGVDVCTFDEDGSMVVNEDFERAAPAFWAIVRGLNKENAKLRQALWDASVHQSMRPPRISHKIESPPSITY